ncbi:ribonuclease H2, subunit B [Crucibulum laeve]|uniref:Ribonuclease H2 subunit B n=1 Tax=Crucibulum laeve TaxID=68775 RepID=A0A5C3MKF9_9AGAR|nr:ribonuclease H2, subunit B [Crucibulum laeve]
MLVHFNVLPSDFLQTITTNLEQANTDSDGTNCDPIRLQYLRLPHPRTGLPSLFLPSEVPGLSRSSAIQKSTILEVQAVSPTDARSWFMNDEVVSDGKLLVMTPVDPTFLLLPILQAIQPQNGSAGQFRQLDDISEEAASKLASPSESSATKGATISPQDIRAFCSMACAQKALRSVCDVKEITEDIVVYRYSPEKVVQYLRVKVARLSTSEVIETSRTITRGLARDGLMEDGKEPLLESGRTRAACDLLSQYLPLNTRVALLASYDFVALDSYLKKSADDAALLAPLPKNSTKAKQSTAGENKKRKGTKASQGVEKLKKVNVNGMAKLSSFFKNNAT